jgi:FkbM family methyltransferase
MSFVSYAQNFEDVMLWRALKHVENGFYIDVGANDPTLDSVTKAFYERGWHGINIEPLPSHYADLIQERPQDINLQCAAGASNGEIEVWECDVRGWATASADVMARHTASGHKGTFHRVPVSRLADICAQHVSGEIHFLKIDVEGFEKSVIDGADFSRFRPWIIVIEATKPNSTEEIHGEWESTVLSADYDLGYTDGLNRFYVAKERDELRNSLRYPPNVFDEFIRSEQLDSELRAQQAEAKAQQAEAKAQQAEAKAQQAEAKAQQAETKAQQAETKAQQAEAASIERFAQLQAVYASTSWRLTKPIRAFKRILGGDFSILGRSAAAVTRFLPRPFRVIRNTGVGLGQEASATFESFSVGHLDAALMPQTMTPRARRIYVALKAAVDKKNLGSR